MKLEYQEHMQRNQIPYFSKNCSICVPTILSLDNGDTITSPYDFVNTCNNYFASIAKTTKNKQTNICINIFRLSFK